ncbi:RraA family protein [Youhaiella tibetensis]|uniref:Putative 4-hydroxy-4-methyl-2-oxoglutarate aldolase n=1 Tax=Paradevosia tibetensis TaxID=1447062 RepID=A0A5B9DRE1_9HYPH|nr:RraA family protein [Youhaiella tibetensis]
MSAHTLSEGDLLRLRRFSTPTVYNGWEQVSRVDRRSVVNRDVVQDFMPQFGPMIGYAVTLEVEPSNPRHIDRSEAPREYRAYLESVPGPKIVVVKDADSPNVIGTYFGEVNASLHRALGCVGMITDGGVRDIVEMGSLGFKALAQRLCVGHAYAWPVRWGHAVEVFGLTIEPGQLLHADQHGFMVIPEEDQARVLEATQFMDANECHTVIGASQLLRGGTMAETRQAMVEAEKRFGAAARQQFGKSGEWSD